MPTKGMSKIKGPVLYEPKPLESTFILRIPNEYKVALDALVLKGVAKSRNELVVEIIRDFLSTLRKKAEADNIG